MSSSSSHQSPEINQFIEQEIQDESELKSPDFSGFWLVIRHEFPDRPYEWRRELCLHLMHRMLREDRCRLGALSSDLGELPADEDGNWKASVDDIMAVLRSRWSDYENKTELPAVGGTYKPPDGFDICGYFLGLIPQVVWPPYKAL